MVRFLLEIKFLFPLLILVIAGCSSSQKTVHNGKSIHQFISKSTIFNNHFTGFSLYDPASSKFIINKNEDKYFTPASNTKIITLFAALKNLPSVLPSYKFVETESEILIKGMGDPTFLHPLWQHHAGLEKLVKSPKAINMVYDQLQDNKLGAGWAWDDYNEDYQAEVNDFPLYGNLVEFKYDSNQFTFQTSPGYFKDKWYWNLKSPMNYKIFRKLDMNEFVVDTSLRKNYSLPFKTDPNVIKEILQDTLKRRVNLISGNTIDINSWQIQSGVQIDSVYAQMMKVSDNFIAEQLILSIGSYFSDTCHTTYVLNKLKKQLFDTMPPFQWFDGSGLSRYNLITPKHLIHLLNYIYFTKGVDWIKKIFPAGGESGTIKNSYKGNPAYVYAKTGSLMNNHSLSGYVSAKSGKWYIFSFMHSNYTGSVLPIRQEMQKTLEYIRDHF